VYLRASAEFLGSGFQLHEFSKPLVAGAAKIQIDAGNYKDDDDGGYFGSGEHGVKSFFSYWIQGING
jgi:hypothetical protein